MPAWEDYLAHLDRRSLAVVQEDAILHLAGFVRDAWHVLEPGTELCWAPYLDVLCRECEAVYRGEVRDLTVCIPPGLMKSLLISVLLPAWWWLHDPCERFLCLSHDDDLARRDSRRMRDVILSDYYQALVERQAALGRVKRWMLKHGHNQLDNYGTTSQGFRQCLSIGGAITGKRGNVVLLDDPHDVRDVVLGSHEQVRRRLADTAHVVEQVLPTRVNDRRTARWITIQQRLHDEDTAGRRIRRGKTRPVVLPMHYDPDHPESYEHDPRTEPGELLHPVFMPELEVAALVEQLGDQAPGQLEQRPIAAVGGLYRREHFAHRYEKRPEWVRRQHARCIVSVDATFKGGSKTDYVVLGAWVPMGPRVALLDVLRARMDYPTTREALRDFAARWKATEIVVEEKANGPALIAELRRELPGVVAFDPRDSKVVRAQATAVYWRAGDVLLPQAEHAPWLVEYIAEHLSFPAGAHDDQVDMSTQLLIYLYLSGAAEGSGFLAIA